jgi:hypothetical protein
MGWGFIAYNSASFFVLRYPKILAVMCLKNSRRSAASG